MADEVEIIILKCQNQNRMIEVDSINNPWNSTDSPKSPAELKKILPSIQINCKLIRSSFVHIQPFYLI